ncbi:MAG: fibronectin type III domain-containing protein [Phycisphaerales bacterium]
MRVRVMAATMVGASVVAMGLGGWSRLAGGDPVEFARTQMYIEYNASAGDIGVQVSMDGDPWRQLRVFRPDGKLIMEVKGKKSLALQGFTELFFESSEPPLATLPLPVFFARFPAGCYEFEGVTIEGEEIEGTAHFTHAIPQKPVVLAPVEGSVQNASNTMVVWLPVPNPAGSEIVAYQVTVTQVLDVLPKRVFSVHVPAGTASMKVPQQFLQKGAEYEFEVLAIEAGGNQTIHAGFFSTAP